MAIRRFVATAVISLMFTQPSVALGQQATAAALSGMASTDLVAINMSAVTAFTPPLPPCAPGYEMGDMVAMEEGSPTAAPPYGDALGDAWEMQEVACWRGFWLRRSKSDLFDAYWIHPAGERVRATLQMWRNGRSVTIVRRHTDGRYCRYDGTISPDWWSVQGRYTCTWARTPMPWRARIVRLEKSLPQLLR